MLLIALITPLTVAVGLYAAVALTPLPAPSNPEVTRFLDSKGNLIATRFQENRIEIPVTEMPDYLLDAIVAIEDDRFYKHRGIDVIGIGRAMLHNLLAGEIVEGGSTLTQQLAKNLYLSPERTLLRKIKEAILTIKLERSYTKKEILGIYWNTVYLGRGAYGVETAAQTLFGKSARDVTLDEAALLAGLPRAPEYYANREEAANQRRNLVLDKMAEHGLISPGEAAQAKQRPTRLRDTGMAGAGPDVQAPYFIDYVVRELQDRHPEVAQNLRNGGYTIETSLDLSMQRAAEEAIARELPRDQGGADQEAELQAALVAIDPVTGYIRAFVGGRDQTVRINRVLEPQQPGSAFKPFVYAAALDSRRHTVMSTQPDEPVAFPGGAGGEPYRPNNYGNRYSYQQADMRRALRESLNVVAVQWMHTISPEPVISLARRMGIEQEIPRQDLSVALGSAEVSPLELTVAFAPFSNGGYAIRPISILRVLDRHGNVILDHGPERRPALDPGVAFIMTDLLKDVTRPGGTAANVAGYMGGRPVAGKTGTSDESRDAWFVGYTPDLVAGVWVGRDDNASGTGTGGSLAAPVWAHFMSRALSDRPHRDWSPPPNVVRQEVCALTGLLPNASCPVRREWFLRGTVPTEVDPTVHWDESLPDPSTIPWTPSDLVAPDLDWYRSPIR